MYPPLTLFGISVLLPALLASALPHSGSSITQRAQSTLEETLTLKLEPTEVTRYAKDLNFPLELVRSDEITDDGAVLYNTEAELRNHKFELVARTMKDGSKIEMNPKLQGILIAYGHDGAKDEADRRWWLVHVRPDQPRELYFETNPTIPLHWKEKQNSDAEWEKIVLEANRMHNGKWLPNGLYVTDDWIDEKTGEKMSVEVITRPNRNNGEMTAEEVEKFLDGRPLLAYGFEATTELYTKRWWIVTELSEKNKKSTTE